MKRRRENLRPGAPAAEYSLGLRREVRQAAASQNGRSTLSGTADFDGRGEINIRGFSSLRLPKHSYTFKTKEESGKSVKAPLLGFPALRKNGLDFWFDSAAAHCYLRTAGWRSKIIRLLQKF